MVLKSLTAVGLLVGMLGLIEGDFEGLLVGERLGLLVGDCVGHVVGAW
jgi:uncharacterized membrane protein